MGFCRTVHPGLAGQAVLPLRRCVPRPSMHRRVVLVAGPTNAVECSCVGHVVSDCSCIKVDSQPMFSFLQIRLAIARR